MESRLAQCIQAPHGPDKDIFTCRRDAVLRMESKKIIFTGDAGDVSDTKPRLIEVGTWNACEVPNTLKGAGWDSSPARANNFSCVEA